jgi:hypothetical protein
VLLPYGRSVLNHCASLHELNGCNVEMRANRRMEALASCDSEL